MSESRALKRAFSSFDTDSNDKVDFNEFIRAMEHFGLHTSEYGLKGGAGGLGRNVAQALFDRFDTAGDGALSYPEVSAVVRKKVISCDFSLSRVRTCLQFEAALLQKVPPHPAPQITKPRSGGAKITL